MGPVLRWTFLAVGTVALGACQPRPTAASDQTAASAPCGQVSFEYARGIHVSCYGSATLVTVDPGDTGTRIARYWLVPRGSTPPSTNPDAEIIHTPVRSYALESFTGLLSVIDELGLERGLVGVSSFDELFPSYHELTRLRKSGQIRQTGGGAGINQEILLDLSPELVIVMFYEHSSLSALGRAGVHTIVFGMEQEKTALARAEWVKLLALLFNRGQDGSRLFEGVRQRYLSLARRTRDRPAVKVLATKGAADRWTSYGFEREFIKDGGGRLVIPGDAYDADFSSEYVIENGMDAPVWPFASPRWRSIQEAVRADPALGMLTAVRTGRVYCNNAKRVAGYVNPYYTAAFVRPDEILADLVTILHPETALNHELIYFRKVPER